MTIKSDERYVLPELVTSLERAQGFMAKKRILISRISTFLLVGSLLFTYHPLPLPQYGFFIFKSFGFILVALCMAGRLWSTLYIGGRKTHTLITEGPYSVVRHPLYLFSFLGGMGIALSSYNLWSIGLFLLFFMIYYPAVMTSEELKMRHIHGDAYESYIKKTPRFIPRFTNYRTEEYVEVNFRKFRRELLHTMYFLMIYYFFEIVQFLHTQDILPTLF